ncbi:MAG: transglutaminase-like cysteine peptidase, partial [Cycloclasticus sp.]
MTNLFKIISVLLMVLLTACASSPKVEMPVSDGINSETRERVQAWKTLIENGSRWSDIQKLNSVNNFVNEVEFVDDIYHWKMEDYWATPLQTLVTKAGDCEDLSIAKYFTLAAMGLDENKMRLTYVKALDINKPHMVVSYFRQPTDEPLVLDNLNPAILPA